MKAKNHIKREPVACIFFIILIVSFCWHIAFRNDHFQEVDSATVYQMAHDFPASALHATAIFYPPGHIFSTSTAERILANPLVRSIKDKHISSISDDVILSQLTKTSLSAAIRFAFIQGITSVNLPFAIRTMFALPLSSTYSAGPGLIHGIIAGFSGADISYDAFMSRSLAVTILVFHLAMLFLFLTLRKLGISEFLSASTGLLALFSISMYSSGLHLGSTVWMFAVEFLWIWILIGGKDTKNQDVQNGDAKSMTEKRNRQISIATAWMVFFNYLIILFWAAYMLTSLIDEARIWKKDLSAHKQISSKLKALSGAFLSWLWKKAREQRIAIIFIVICALIFYQSGQGFRGGASIMELPTYIYYILLNFTSWYTHSAALNILQFLIALELAILALWFAFGFNFSKNLTPATIAEPAHILRRVFQHLIIIYAIAVMFQVLSFLPTRHMLFLSPVFFIASALGLNAFWQSIRHAANPKGFFAFAKTKINFFDSMNGMRIVTLIFMSAIGFACLNVRRIDVRDLRPLIPIASSASADMNSFVSDISSYGIYDASHDLYYYLNDRGEPVDFINPNKLEIGKTYLYISHSEPFETALQEWQSKLTIQTETIWTDNRIQPVYFMAHNPDFAKLRFSRPNNLYQTKFKVMSK